jgi:hypothetical protein
MNLLDLLAKSGGQASLGQLGSQLGIGSSDMGGLVGALAPALMRSFQQQTKSDSGLGALQSALSKGNHQRYLDAPDLMATEEARTEGNSILGHLFGSKDVSRNVAAQAAENTGIDASLIKKALPLIASLAMGAMSKSSNSGRSLERSAFDNSGDLASGGGFGLDDVLSLAKKFF